MAEWHLPFAPPQHQAEEAVAEAPVVKREWDPNYFLLCSHCEKPITQGAPGMEFTPGKSGFGARSGRPMLVDDEHSDYEKAVLHIGCIYDYVFNIEETMAYADEEPQFCAGCEARLSGDEG